MADAITVLAWPRDGVLAPDARPRPWLVGIHRGGVHVARELADVIALSEGWRPLLGSIDVSFYRDDVWLRGPRATDRGTDLPGDPTGQRIVLVDDVLFTGRTTRAALNVLMDFGRPEAVRLCVLIERGGRELPLAADFAGAHADVGPADSVELHYDADGRIGRVGVEARVARA
ncbi:MAG: bifunctional pyr operon transcriptional regulator/uracil phosphoribosyltransferase PyrR [Myxococcales bacterium]|nr:bifunctional pyr operon transcriptional regulator/uracil phosphoribosyltransferase PyrR [Myxococcales bacterium]